MPYAFAHPAAVVPAHRLLGRHAVASALVLGSVVPDLWYALPGLDRPHTHGALSLFWFCLPAGLFAYVAYHLLLKQPLAALLPDYVADRVAPYLGQGLPAKRWFGVVVSLLAGAATHLAWDAVTHEGVLYRTFSVLHATFTIGGREVRLQQILQHGSTVAGAGFLAWWSARWLRRAPPAAGPAFLRQSPVGRLAVIATATLAGLVAFWVPLAVAAPASMEALRAALRGSALSAAAAGSLVLLGYCLLWQLQRRQDVDSAERDEQRVPPLPRAVRFRTSAARTPARQSRRT